MRACPLRSPGPKCWTRLVSITTFQREAARPCLQPGSQPGQGPPQATSRLCCRDGNLPAALLVLDPVRSLGPWGHIPTRPLPPTISESLPCTQLSLPLLSFQHLFLLQRDLPDPQGPPLTLVPNVSLGHVFSICHLPNPNATRVLTVAPRPRVPVAGRCSVPVGGASWAVPSSFLDAGVPGPCVSAFPKPESR